MVHAYHHSKSSDRENKIKEAIFAVGSPIVASALSTMGASAFLFGCRTWVFIELGILICSITAMALLYTMTFLFAWLALAGPLPIDQNGHKHSHRWDLKVMCWIPCQKDKMSSSIDTTNEKSEQREDDESVYSIEVVEDLEENPPLPGKFETERSKVEEAEDDDSVYEVVDDDDDDDDDEIVDDDDDELAVDNEDGDAIDAAVVDEEKAEDNESVHSIEVVEDDDEKEKQ